MTAFRTTLFAAPLVLLGSLGPGIEPAHAAEPVFTPAPHDMLERPIHLAPRPTVPGVIDPTRTPEVIRLALDDGTTATVTPAWPRDGQR